jgi:Ca2+-binding RTX toxin-like protein
MATKRLMLVTLAAVIAMSLLPWPARAGSRCFGRAPTITDGPDGNVVHGTQGDDVIAARGGKDRVFARGGDDVVCAGGNKDRVRGGPGADLIGGGLGSDVPFSTSENNDFLGGLLGNRGDDTILGGDGIDRLQGGKGDDILEGGLASDNGVGAAGIASNRGNDHRPAGGRFHAFWAGKILGGSGDDRLAGEEGDDILNSRDGVEFNDRLNGGAGPRDTCRSDPDHERRC